MLEPTGIADVVESSPMTDPTDARVDFDARFGLARGLTAEEYLPALAACLRDAGFDAQMESDGSMTSRDGSVDGRFQAAKAACERAIGPAPTPMPLTRAEIGDRYPYLLAMRDCLVAIGCRISDPPTEDVFIGTWDTGPWSPYNDVPAAGFERAEAECPQVPEEPRPGR